MASVKMVSGSEESPVSGYILLTQADAESPVYVRGEIRGLRAGPHGFHIHEIGNTDGECAGRSIYSRTLVGFTSILAFPPSAWFCLD